MTLPLARFVGILNLLILGSVSGFAFAEGLSTYCVVRDGTGYGYARNRGTEFEHITGNIWFRFYDSDGDLITSSLRGVNVTVPPGARVFVGEHGAPSDAVECEIEL